MRSKIAGMIWPQDRSRFFADAYALRGATGVPLLLHMGSFDLWHGSLAQMRGDSPAETVTSASDDADDANARRFLQTLALSRALDMVPQECAEVVRAAYLNKQNANTLESEQCTKRLLAAASAVYRELVSNDASMGDPDRPPPDHVATSAEGK